MTIYRTWHWWPLEVASVCLYTSIIFPFRLFFLEPLLNSIWSCHSDPAWLWTCPKGDEPWVWKTKTYFRYYCLQEIDLLLIVPLYLWICLVLSSPVGFPDGWLFWAWLGIWKLFYLVEVIVVLVSASGSRVELPPWCHSSETFCLPAYGERYGFFAGRCSGWDKNNGNSGTIRGGERFW